MRRENLVTTSVIVIVLLIAGGIIFFKFYQGFAIKDTLAEETAKCIGKNSVLYVQVGCIHCREQEDLFGYNVRYLTIVDCFHNLDQCTQDNITATPTWIINGKEYIGIQSIEKLKELTGC